MNHTNEFDVIIVGGGHAGCEAALACARMGLTAAMFTMSLDAVGNMPCNPSVGGTAKSHLVYEIDALGGEMGYAADCATIQSRTLNTGKGAAVRSKRVQADRVLYHACMKRALEAQPRLSVIQAEVTSILTEDAPGGRRVVRGVSACPGGDFYARAVILATGTYLAGHTHVGTVQREAGPDNSLPAAFLSASLAAAGLPLMRFKTGTPPRIHRRSIDFDALEVQPGDEYITPFSRRTDEARLNGIRQIPCHITYTNEATHAVIRENLHLSPMYSGQIHGTGPRYCPSIEDKIVRFADKERHQLFVEPMGRDTDEMYLQGFSSSLPAEVQYKMLRTLDGFHDAEIMRYAYAIEYDCVDPRALLPTLETKAVANLYGAGQFNGTSGYEEAAAQGLLAGINAASALLGIPPLVLTRDSSYLGVLVDDLVTKGTNEPYRMMTSRSEYRLLLRQDNAEERLIEYGRRAGLIDAERYGAFLARRRAIDTEKDRLEKTFVSAPAANPVLEAAGTTPLAGGASLAELLRRPQLTYAALAPLDGSRPALSRRDAETMENEIKYAGYIRRQADAARRMRRLDESPLPADLDYKKIPGLRLEAAQKLDAVRPLSVGQAERISGVNPADITVLLIWLSQHGHRASGEGENKE
ncbi:MAG: tRNA uridine-5-carboxymethylaminomethyl(34) synthesis enzyme MnmG [Eubacteriales bacterium]